MRIRRGADAMIESHRATEHTAPCGRVLVLVSERAAGAYSRGTICTMGVTLTFSRSCPALKPACESYDLVAIDLAGSACTALSWSLRLLARRSPPEVVFFSEDRIAPEGNVLRLLGIEPIAMGPGAYRWLVDAASALVRLARARKELADAQANAPRFVSPTGALHSDSILPLPVAEARFRESYLRVVLASSGSRARAAATAGVPYRTMCKILQRMQITSAETGDRAPPRFM